MYKENFANNVINTGHEFPRHNKDTWTNIIL